MTACASGARETVADVRERSRDGRWGGWGEKADQGLEFPCSQWSQPRFFLGYMSQKRLSGCRAEGGSKGTR